MNKLGRVLAIDFGKKRCGIAVSDPLKIIATALFVVPPKELIYFLKQYFSTEIVDQVIIGLPLNADDSDTDVTKDVRKFIRNFKLVFPQTPIITIDESYSSVRAAGEIHRMQLPKHKREQKGILDEVAATLLLQDYLSNEV